MNLTLICVFYPPINSSAAVQVHHLVEELARQGHYVEVITPDSTITKPYAFEREKNIKIMRFNHGRMTDISLVKRAINEFLMPFKIIYLIYKNSIKLEKSNGIIWWSPSIFFTPLIIYLKIINKCSCYLILRDIFPKWAKDLKIIKNGIIYQFFNLFFLIQCFFSDIIAVQSEGNRKFIPRKIMFKKNNVTVLNNWYSPNSNNQICPINLSKTILKKKKVFVHAGNIGLAQGFEILMNVVEKLKNNDEIGFLFIGRGSQFQKMRNIASEKSISNVLFYEQIENKQIMSLYKQCHYGIVILDRRHKTHNIPGKLLSYLHAGLPVFALVNPKNDLIPFINKKKVGIATSIFEEDQIMKSILNLSNLTNLDFEINKRCIKVAKEYFDTTKIANQILNSFKEFLNLKSPLDFP